MSWTSSNGWDNYTDITLIWIKPTLADKRYVLLVSLDTVTSAPSSNHWRWLQCLSKLLSLVKYTISPATAFFSHILISSSVNINIDRLHYDDSFCPFSTTSLTLLSSKIGYPWTSIAVWIWSAHSSIFNKLQSKTIYNHGTMLSS